MTTNNNDTNNGSMSAHLSQPPLNVGLEMNKNCGNCNNELSTKIQECQGEVSSIKTIPNTVSLKNEISTLLPEQVKTSKKAKDAQQKHESSTKQKLSDNKKSNIYEYQRPPIINTNNEFQLKGTENEKHISKSTSNQEIKTNDASQRYQISSSSLQKKSMAKNGLLEYKKDKLESTRTQNNTRREQNSSHINEKSTTKCSSQNEKVVFSGTDKNQNMLTLEEGKGGKNSHNKEVEVSGTDKTKKILNSKITTKLTENSSVDSIKNKSESTHNNENTTTYPNSALIGPKSANEISTQKKDSEISEIGNNKNSLPPLEANEKNDTTDNKKSDLAQSCPLKTMDIIKEEIKIEAEKLISTLISSCISDFACCILDEIVKNGIWNIHIFECLKLSFWNLINTFALELLKGIVSICCKWLVVQFSFKNIGGGLLGNVFEILPIFKNLLQGRLTVWQAFKNLLTKAILISIEVLSTSVFGILGSKIATSIAVNVIKYLVNKYFL